MHLAENMEKTKGKQEFPKLTLLVQKIGHVTTVQLLFRMICIVYLLLAFSKYKYLQQCFRQLPYKSILPTHHFTDLLQRMQLEGLNLADMP